MGCALKLAIVGTQQALCWRKTPQETCMCSQVLRQLRLWKQCRTGVCPPEISVSPLNPEIPSSMPLRISFSSSSVYSQKCSFQLSPFSLRRTTSSLSFPRRAAKWGISTITGLTQQCRTLSVDRVTSPKTNTCTLSVAKWPGILLILGGGQGHSGPSSRAQWLTEGDSVAPHLRGTAPQAHAATLSQMLFLCECMWHSGTSPLINVGVAHLTKRNVHAGLWCRPVS